MRRGAAGGLSIEGQGVRRSGAGTDETGQRGAIVSSVTASGCRRAVSLGIHLAAPRNTRIMLSKCSPISIEFDLDLRQSLAGLLELYDAGPEPAARTPRPCIGSSPAA